MCALVVVKSVRRALLRGEPAADEMDSDVLLLLLLPWLLGFVDTLHANHSDV